MVRPSLMIGFLPGWYWRRALFQAHAGVWNRFS
jgi:hypothetical protein